MKEHAIFVGKVALGAAIAIIVVGYLQKQMDAKATKSMVAPMPQPAVAEAAAPTA